MASSSKTAVERAISPVPLWIYHPGVAGRQLPVPHVPEDVGPRAAKAVFRGYRRHERVDLLDNELPCPGGSRPGSRAISDFTRVTDGVPGPVPSYFPRSRSSSSVGNLAPWTSLPDSIFSRRSSAIPLVHRIRHVAPSGYLFGCSWLTHSGRGGPGIVWNISEVVDELVPVSGEDAAGEPQRLGILVEPGAAHFHHRYAAVVGQLEERGLVGVRRPDDDVVAVARPA